jgi:hypothetical protein
VNAGAYFNGHVALVDDYEFYTFNHAHSGIWKRAIFRKVKESKRSRGGVVFYAAQVNVQIDAEIAEKGRLRTKTNLGEETTDRDTW